MTHHEDSTNRENLSLEALTIALLCRTESISASELERVSASEWSQVLDWAQEHRFAACLNYRLSQAGLIDILPENARAPLAAAYERASFRALAMQRDLVNVSNMLLSAGIEHLFLKGAYLARFAYPELGLRPMRDLDVLVGRGDGLKAFQALLNAGLERKPAHMGSPDAYLDKSKHLPPLKLREGTTVEIHMRTTAPSLLLTNDRYPGTHEQLRERRICLSVAGANICFPGPEDQLLHICVHSAIDHQFNNGPLILTDVACFLTTHSIDWSLLWQLAEEQGSVRGLALVLRLVERECPGVLIEWNDQAARMLTPDDPVLEVAAHSLFRSFEARGDVALQAELDQETGLAGKAGRLFRRVFPHRAEMAREAPHGADSPWLYFYYPVKWWRLRLRLYSYIRSRMDPRAQEDVERLKTITTWLKG